LFGRNKQGSGMGRNRQNAGLGQGGTCVCTVCHAEVAHRQGTPCYEMKCPECGAPMSREGLEETRAKPRVFDKACIGCEKCVRACPFGAISMVGDKALIDPGRCTNCRKCLAVCPTGAIR